MDVEAILNEAIVAGSVAREAETQRLLEDMRVKGRGTEDLCGWSWLDIDPEGYQQFKRIATGKSSPHSRPFEWLSIPGGEIQVDPQDPFPYRLSLKDVSSYQRIYASLAGLKAAADVLSSYGVHAEQHRYLD